MIKLRFMRLGLLTIKMISKELSPFSFICCRKLVKIDKIVDLRDITYPENGCTLTLLTMSYFII